MLKALRVQVEKKSGVHQVLEKRADVFAGMFVAAGGRSPQLHGDFTGPVQDVRQQRGLPLEYGPQPGTRAG